MTMQKSWQNIPPARGPGERGVRVGAGVRAHHPHLRRVLPPRRPRRLHLVHGARSLPQERGG